MAVQQDLMNQLRVLHGKELAQLKEVNSSKTEIIAKLENDISTWKENSGQENNEQLSTKLEGKERELEGVLFQLKENKNDLERAKVRYLIYKQLPIVSYYQEQYNVQIIEHGKAQEQARTLREENNDLKIEKNDLIQSCEVQKARNDRNKGKHYL